MVGQKVAQGPAGVAPASQSRNAERLGPGASLGRPSPALRSEPRPDARLGFSVLNV